MNSIFTLVDFGAMYGHMAVHSTTEQQPQLCRRSVCVT